MWHIGSVELTFHHSPERCHLSLMGIIIHLVSDKATLTPVHLVLRTRSSLTLPHSQGPHLLLVISSLSSRHFFSAQKYERLKTIPKSLCPHNLTSSISNPLPHQGSRHRCSLPSDPQNVWSSIVSPSCPH